jgi:hypothetical protein
MTAITKTTASTSLADLAARVQAEHQAVMAAVRSGAEHAMAAGDLLIQAAGRAWAVGRMGRTAL